MFHTLDSESLNTIMIGVDKLITDDKVTEAKKQIITALQDYSIHIEDAIQFKEFLLYVENNILGISLISRFLIETLLYDQGAA